MNVEQFKHSKELDGRTVEVRITPGDDRAEAIVTLDGAGLLRYAVITEGGKRRIEAELQGEWARDGDSTISLQSEGGQISGTTFGEAIGPSTRGELRNLAASEERGEATPERAAIAALVQAASEELQQAMQADEAEGRGIWKLPKPGCKFCTAKCSGLGVACVAGCAGTGPLATICAAGCAAIGIDCVTDCPCD